MPFNTTAKQRSSWLQQENWTWPEACAETLTTSLYEKLREGEFNVLKANFKKRITHDKKNVKQ